MLNAVIALVLLATALALLIATVARACAADNESLVDRLEMLLPRIQCAQCGYPGCRPYAQAIADGTAAINRCPPGGEQTVHKLAGLLGRDLAPVDYALGAASLERIALIDEEVCIGCNLCARACPVDAIVGVARTMHTVIAEDCTGCELCLAPCPVDCIAMIARRD